MNLREALALFEAKIDDVVASTLIHLAEQLREGGVTGSELEATLEEARREIAAWRNKELARARAWLEAACADK
jgi:hypothetical protein